MRDVPGARHKTEPRRFFIYEQYQDDAALKPTALLRTFCSLPGKNCPRSRTAVRGICSNRWASRLISFLAAPSREADAAMISGFPTVINQVVSHTGCLWILIYLSVPTGRRTLMREPT